MQLANLLAKAQLLQLSKIGSLPSWKAQRSRASVAEEDLQRIAARRRPILASTVARSIAVNAD